VVPPGLDLRGLAVLVKRALEAGDIAAVLLRSRGSDERRGVHDAKALAPHVQEKGAALILEGDPRLVAQTGADGVHIIGMETLKPALAMLKPAHIVGCGRLATRHDAMLAAEAGADYVMFGEPDEAGQRPSFDAIVERLSWWAELFEVPCVGFASTLQEVEPLAVAGADFVALGDWAFSDQRGCGAAVSEAARRMRTAERVP
jgi:thiamine-phosphate pyrophosphorylase